MASLSIAQVWKYYGKTPAVKDLSVEVGDGEFLSILGPSGCGKSSTLRMLAGLEHISAGDIRFGARRVNELPPRDRDIAMVFENYALYPHKTVYDNVANALRLRRMPADEIDRKVRWAARMLEIEPLLGRRPVELSGGQKQRTAIGRAIVREPALFLFDEPIAHLDAKLRAHMRGELKLMQKRLGTTMVYVTHDQLEAMSMADRIAVMHDGVLQQLGTPQDIYNHPVNEWVAGFVGEPPMNFLDVEVADRDGRPHLVHPSFGAALTGGQAARLRNGLDGRSVRMGIRPDDIDILAGDAAALPIAARVKVTEPIGGDMLVSVALGDDSVLVKTRPSFTGAMDTACRIGFAADRWHVFSKDTGVAWF